MSGRTLRTFSVGAALAVALALAVPVATEAAELSFHGTVPSSWTSGWDALAGLWEKVGAAIGSLWGDAADDSARTASFWDKQGGGADPNGTSGSVAGTACGTDPSAPCGAPVAE